MKRGVLETQITESLSNKRARIATDDVDSAYVSLGTSTPRTTGSPICQARNAIEGSVASTAGSRRPKIFLCTHEGCDKAFDRPARLEIHIRSHTNERPFVCEQPGCGKSFVRSEHLKAHVKSKHVDDRDYICSYQIGDQDNGDPLLCGKSFHTGTRLRRHIAAHEDKEQTKCQECGQIFRKQDTLQRHIRSAHLHEHAYRCSHIAEEEECGQAFATVGQLKAHEARQHAGVRYFCDQCHSQDQAMEQPGFTTYADLQLHLKTVHPPTCGICGHIANSNRGLRAHMEIVHQSLSDRQRFDCMYEGCDRKFTKQGNLKVHIQTVHAQVKAYTCGDHDLTNSKNLEGWSGLGCGISFGTKAALEQHVRTQHLGLAVSEHTKVDRKRSTRISRQPSVGPATSKITGYAYEEDRPVACLEMGCANRFRREHDLVIHLELHHSWNIDDINDTLAEIAALNGEKFWIGGVDNFGAEQPVSGEVAERRFLMDMATPPPAAATLTPRFELMDLDPQLTG